MKSYEIMRATEHMDKFVSAWLNDCADTKPTALAAIRSLQAMIFAAPTSLIPADHKHVIIGLLLDGYDAIESDLPGDVEEFIGSAEAEIEQLVG